MHEGYRWKSKEPSNSKARYGSLPVSEAENKTEFQRKENHTKLLCVCVLGSARVCMCFSVCARVLLRSFRTNAPPSLPACHTIPHPLASSLYLQHAPSVSSSLSPCLKLLSSPIYSMNDFLVASVPLRLILHHVSQSRKIPRSEDGWLLEWCFSALMD